MESINGNGESRLDRIERLLESSQVRNDAAWARQKEAWTESRARHDEAWERHREALEDFEREHKRLLIAQVVMADAAAKSDLKLAELTDKLSGLIAVIDGRSVTGAPANPCGALRTFEVT